VAWRDSGRPIPEGAEAQALVAQMERELERKRPGERAGGAPRKPGRRRQP
jgi:hypothetical protein